MDEKIIKDKIEKSLEIICPLYKDNLITDAYIIGSVASGEVEKESDIDVVIINPIFIMASADLPAILPLEMEDTVVYMSEMEKNRDILRRQIVDKLINIGVEFRVVHRKDDYLWYQFYKNEMFHLLPFNESFHIENLPNIRLTKDLCE